MDDKSIYIDTQKVDYKIQNKERGEILYYSINQISNLLNENIDNIKYYTNIFYDLLQIEIIDKELCYTNNDVDKLESLIKLKNKGMSIKEIQDYYKKLPLNDTEIHQSKNNLLSVEELIDSIKAEQQFQLDNLKIQLINEIQNSNSLYLQNITSTIIEAQNKKLNEFKQDLYKEMKEYLNSKFDSFNDININLHDNFINNTNELISKKIDSENKELPINLENYFNIFSERSLDNDKHLKQEIKDLKGVILNAYSIQSEVEMDIAKIGLKDRLFQIVKNK